MTPAGSMVDMVTAVALLAAVNIAYKGAGPAVLGDREFGIRTRSVVDALPAALLAALLVVELLGPYWQEVDWTMLPGLGAAIALRLAHRPHLLCIVAAVTVTAVTRAVL